ncbi:M56 family metallopeptidase [Granulicella sibirica]|uniref:CHP03435 domain-containing protein n=1 Tax=Granulicella sibirica TaxID=2479048 RepID=A0A4Q0T766_9BACT|nr:M56 family metallopeptidase [Granulicella sibirica]RXH58892.1 CHP03435 domain-containing protein [Granulicella sibirica]
MTTLTTLSAFLLTPLADHLWQSTLVAALAWLLATALRRNHARARYWIWMIASMKFLLPFALLISFGATLRTKTLHPIPTPALSAVIEPVTAMEDSFSITSSHPTASSLTPASALTPHHSVLPSIILAVWLSGSLFLLATWLLRWSKVRSTAHAARPIDQINGIPILSSASMLEPGVFGIARPVLILPEGITDRLTTAQLNSILAHELSHIHRRDNLTAAIHMAVETLFWFHPAVWFIKSRLLEERERACDEAVLQSGNEAEVYAESILNVCKFYVESPLTCVSGVTGSDLKQRIVRIMTAQIADKLDLNRKLLLGLTAAVALALPFTFGLVHVKNVHAQIAVPQDLTKDISGTWQGTLHADRDLRAVLKITRASDGTWKSTFYSIDQGGQATPVPTTTFQDKILKYELPLFGIKYVGTLSPDGKTITGEASQGEKPLPLVYTRTTPETAWAIPEPRPRTPPMDPKADPSFEVATIEPTAPDEKRKMLIFDGHDFKVVNRPLSFLISFAYSVQLKQIVGAPAWYETEKYDITAVPDTPGAPNVAQLRSMVRKLLVDRYKLTLHHDKRDLSVYVLSVAKSGPKMTKGEDDPNGLPGFQFRGLGKLSVFHSTMPEFAQMMQESILDRPVVDQTGLAGRYDFPLNWAPDDSQFGGAAASAPPATDTEPLPNLFTAIQEQAGLKLDATRAPTDVLVIDHLEKPSEN